MAVGELDATTLAALQEQTGGTIEPATEPAQEPASTTTETVVEQDSMEFKPAESKPEVETEVPAVESETSESTEVDPGIKQLQDAGIDTVALAKALKETGEIPADMVDKAKTVFPADEVDAGVKTLTDADAERKAVDKMNTFIFDSVGGKDKFSAPSDTLKAKLPADQLTLLNAKIGSGNELLVAEGMKEAVKEYNKLRGMGGKLMSGDAGAVRAEDALPRVTKDDFRVIIKSEKYKTDPAYAKKMDEARIATSKADKAHYGPGQYYGFTNGQKYAL